MTRLAVVALALVHLTCAPTLTPPARPALLPPPVCPDGLPILWLQHPACGRVCGYSCMPDRWRVVAPGETKDGKSL